MPKLIDADKLITTIQGTESEVARNAPYDAEWFTRMADRQFEILKMIDDAPTVDAVEVVHGRYVHKGAWHIECSECKHILAHISEAKNYCPNCGAKMDGDRNG